MDSGCLAALSFGTCITSTVSWTSAIYVHLSTCLTRASTTRERKNLGSPKLAWWIMKAHHTGNRWTDVEVKRSKVKITRTINEQYLSYTERPTKLETWYTDRVRKPVSSTSAMTSKVKGECRKLRGPYDRCWPISRKRKVFEIPKLVIRLPMHRTGNNAYQFQGQNVKSQGHQADYCWDRKCIISTERECLRTSQLVRQWNMRHQLPRPAITASEVGFLHAGGGHTVSAAPGDYKLVTFKITVNLTT